MDEMTEKNKFLLNSVELVNKNNKIDLDLYLKYNVKRGLRNQDGSGVLVGLTKIGDVHGYIIDENELVPVEGRLRYRGISIEDIIKGFQKEKRFGFEETSYLLLFGQLPIKTELEYFTRFLDENRMLPSGFIENMILKSPSSDIMNKLARSVLALYSYDPHAEERSLKNNIYQCIKLIALFPTMIAYAYQAKSHYFNGKSLFIHKPKPQLSTAENFLHLIRHDSTYTRLEAEVLDLALVLHAEHGGGNNSTFTIHVVSSSDTDIYSVIAAAVGSLKGSLHGGANIKVFEMMKDIMKNIKDWEDRNQIEHYLEKIVQKKAGDKSGLIYGMGHAVYTLSDPRAVLFREKIRELAEEKGLMNEFKLYTLVEQIAPVVLKKNKKSKKPISPNVDFYSGFVYNLLDISQELYTPLFAMARIAGWSAHRIEELVNSGKIIRPAYKHITLKNEYIPLDKRGADKQTNL
ncbi:MAG: citrate/2-methylcitrate synthase [Spirochaetales bacterium]|nr:citrate/2-methylcitrate synthase [Spirochaetales bacterium]